MAKYSIATIALSDEEKQYFKQAQAELSKLKLGNNNKIKFIDLTEINPENIQSLGAITSVMYFTDIHNVPNHDNVLSAILKKLPDISDLSVFALSHNEIDRKSVV